MYIAGQQLDEAERMTSELSNDGNWRSMEDGNQYIRTRYLPTATCVASARVDGLVRPWNPHAYVAFGFKPDEFETSRFLVADARFIAAAPRLVRHFVATIRDALTSIGELRRDVTRLRALLAASTPPLNQAPEICACLALQGYPHARACPVWQDKALDAIRDPEPADGVDENVTRELDRQWKAMTHAQKLRSLGLT